MPRKLRELRRDLRRAGFHIVRQSGSHQTWRHADVVGASVTLSGSDGADAKPYQEEDVRQEIAKVDRAKGER